MRHPSEVCGAGLETELDIRETRHTLQSDRLGNQVMIKLILQEEGLTVYELPAGKHRIGRSKHSALCLDHPSVSQEHCEITVDPLMVLVTDLGSTNGTFINGEPIRKAELMTGQVLHIGRLALILDREAQQVVVPDVTPRPLEHVTTLPNGSPCCYNHPTLAAGMKCGHCHKLFCGACVTGIGVIGGVRHHLCPVCHNHCAVYEWDGARARRSWLGGVVSSLKKITGRLLSPPRPTHGPRGRR